MIKTVWSITFHVSDLSRSTDFYEKVLGLNKKYAFSTYVGFECGGVEIGLMPNPDEKSTAGSGSPSVQLLVDDIDNVCRVLRSRGVRFIKELHEETWGGKQATFCDPDGHILEITQIEWDRYFSVAAKSERKQVKSK